jgi:transcriptional regulator with XRE-family HTH domain
MPDTGICPACRAARLARRGDPLCAECTRAAQQLSPRPLWLFDSPLLRHALGQLNLAAVPAIVRAASGLSQADLASIAGWSRSTLGLYEHGQRGAIFDIRVLLQFADSVDLPREALLPLLLGSAGAELVTDTDVDNAGMDLDRRGFTSLAAGVAVAAMLPEFKVPSRITTSHVRYLQSCVDTLWSQDQAVGGAALLQSGLRQWQRARRMVKESSYTESIGRELLSVTGRLGACVGWLAYDGGQHALARHLYGEAQTLAEEAADSVLIAETLEQSSVLATYVARSSGREAAARQALLLTYRAAEEARYEPLPRLHALIALRQASAASLLGDKGAFHAGISRARRELDRGPDSDEPESLRFVNEAEITGFEARGYLNLGEPGRSAELYRAALDGELAPRNRAYYGAALAGSLLRQGSLDEAISEGEVVLPALLNGVASIRTIRELRPIRAAARKVNAEEFCERFDAAERELNILHPVG